MCFQWRIFMGFLALFLVAGCNSRLDSGKGVAAPILQPLHFNSKIDSRVNSTNSKVVRFVSGARIGETSQLSDLRYGSAEVRVLSEFNAATGRLCRRFSVLKAARAARIEQLVACRDKEFWFLVAP